MNGLATIIPAVGEVVNSVLEMLGSVFGNIFALFFTTGEGTFEITTLGYFILIPVAMGIIAWGLRWILKLVNGLKPKN